MNGSTAISYGWASVKKDFWYFVGIAAVSTILGSAASNAKDQRFFFWLVGLCITSWMTAGYWTIVLNYQAGKKLPFSTLFKQFNSILSIIGASILVGIIVAVGFFLLIVPGIYFALKYQFVNQLIIDKKLGILEAMKESARITKGKRMSLLGFDCMCFLVILLGVIALGVGVFVAMPVVWLAEADIYRKLVNAAPAATPATV